MKMTVADIRKALKGVKGHLLVFVSDHDHGEYETNGAVGGVKILNQKNMTEQDKKGFDQSFRIAGDYVSIRIG